MKKKKMKVTLTALMLLLGIFVSAQTVIKRGDANGDGKVNALDLVAVIDFVVNHVSDKISYKAADMNHDGYVTDVDVRKLANYIATNGGAEDEDLDGLLFTPRSGAYEGLYYQSATPFYMFYFLSCLASDEMLGGGGRNDSFNAIDLLSGSLDMSKAWDGYQTNIQNTNEAIRQILDLQSELRDANVRHAMGEVLFLRAFYYHQMASLFGTVPVITDNDSWEQKMKKTTAADVWGQILLDLKEAISLMDDYSPTLGTDDRRVGKYAAEALLARAYLFYTGFYLGHHDIASVSNSDSKVVLPDNSTLSKSDVAAYLEDCIENSDFSLVSDFRNLWPYTNRLTVEDYNYTKGKNLAWVENDGAVNPEVLFKIKYNKNASWNTTVGYSNVPALYFGMRNASYDDTFPFGSGWGAGSVSGQFYDDWTTAEPNDMRREASIQNIEALPSYGYVSDFIQQTPYHEKKISPITCKADEGYAETFEKVMYADDDWNPGSWMQLGNIHPLNLIRLADVLLMHSELTGTVGGINKVRARAGLGAVSNYTLASLQQERRWELAFEGVRWNDMRRWGDDYCKTALDKQMNQPIYNDGVKTSNPLGVPAYTDNPISYAERYAVNRGFFTKPASQLQEGSAALEKLQGRWMLDETAAAGCYGTLKYEHAPIADFLEDPTANGLVKKYTRKELKDLPGTRGKGEIATLAYIEINGNHIKKFNAGNEILAEGDFTITLTDNYDWRICSIATEGATMFCGPEGNVALDLVSLDDDSGQMMIVNGTKASKDSEVAYWSLRRVSYDEDTFRSAHGVKWSYVLYNSSDYSGNSFVVGTLGSASYSSGSNGNGYVPVIYANHIESVTPQNLKTYLEGVGVDTSNGEADPFAYMVLDLNEETISKYTADGTFIESCNFDLSYLNREIQINTTEASILAPYAYGDNGKKQSSFNVRYNQQNYSFPDYAGLAFKYWGDSKDLFSYWLFAKRGLTTAELDKALTVTQLNESGEADSEGFLFRCNYGFETNNNLTVSCADGYGIIYDQQSDIYKVKAPFGQTTDVTVVFTIQNANGTTATVERVMKMTNIDLKPETQLLASTSSKSWTWDYDATGSCWGNMGYCGGAGSDVAFNTNSCQWWGVDLSSEPDNKFENKLQHTDDGKLHGDESVDASMVFNVDGTVKCYDANGKLIRSGTYDILNYDASDPSAWRVGYLTTTAGSILWPYEINSGGNKPTKFDLVYLAEDKFCLVYPDGGDFDGLGNWGEATFWHFKKK